MCLKLIFWHNEKDDELHRRVVERIEFDPAGRSSKCGHDFVEAVGGAMGNGDAESDAGAHGFLALFERSQNAFAVLGFYFAETNEEIDQLDNGRPTVGRLHLGDDLLGRK